MTEHQEPDDAYASLYGPHDPPPLPEGAQAAYDALYAPQQREPLDAEAQAIYDAVFDHSNNYSSNNPNQLS